MAKLSKARIKALEAVRDGLCTRRYTEKGNTLHGSKGVSATTLWHLDRAKLIEDCRTDYGPRCQLVLTTKGLAALAGAYMEAMPALSKNPPAK